MPASPAQPFYDHERPRRRPAPDWGGDDLFDAVPRRRFARERVPANVPADRGGGAVPVAADVPADRGGGAVPVAVRSPQAAASRRPGLRLASEPSAAPPSRRTVTITGHPERLRVVASTRAGRLEQRIHARPERLAAWAVALALLLIVLAVATSG